MTPFFSVIIPLYNKEGYIEDTIKSVLDQTFTEFEVIIINDGSTDKSSQLALNFKDSRIHLTKQKKQGASIARNTGIEQSKGKYIALLDADDIWQPDHLYELKKLIKEFPEAGLYCSNYEINYNGKFIKPASLNFDYGDTLLIVKDYFTSSIINSVAWTSSTSFTKDTFEKLGRFNPKLKTGQDIDLWIRFALDYKIAFNPKITMRYNNFDINSLSKKEFNEDRYMLINNYASEETTNEALKKYLDVNRYAVALRCKMNNEIELYKKLKKEISYSNLNFKQKVILHAPKFMLKSIKRFQGFLIKNKIYMSAYS